jgi:hypothetical protein
MEFGGQLNASAALSPGKQFRYPLDKRPERFHSRTAPYEEEKIFAYRESNLGRSTPIPSLYRLIYPGSWRAFSYKASLSKVISTQTSEGTAKV